MKQKPSYLPKKYKYSARSGNLKAEAVGVVKGEKHFPVFEGDVVFKPLTKSKPLSTPLFAYAEVFWSWVIDAYFMPAPQYQLAFCEGYEAEVEKYYDYGTVSPMIYGEGEHLLNLLEFFRKYPDDKVHIDDYVNYCQMLRLHRNPRIRLFPDPPGDGGGAGTADSRFDFERRSELPLRKHRICLP